MEKCLFFIQFIEGFCGVESFFKNVFFFFFRSEVSFDLVNICLFLFFVFHYFLKRPEFFFYFQDRFHNSFSVASVFAALLHFQDSSYVLLKARPYVRSSLVLRFCAS